jgi:hypothetical protein
VVIWLANYFLVSLEVSVWLLLQWLGRTAYCSSRDGAVMRDVMGAGPEGAVCSALLQSIAITRSSIDGKYSYRVVFIA